MFENIKTLEELKSAYAVEAKKFINEADKMIVVNAELTLAWDKVKNHHITQSGEPYERETDETAADFINRATTVLRLPDVNLECRGSWLWASGNTRPHNTELKSVGFKFAPKKSAWYWRTPKRAVATT